jgi:hypothetical protein
MKSKSLRILNIIAMTLWLGAILLFAKTIYQQNKAITGMERIIKSQTEQIGIIEKIGKLNVDNQRINDSVHLMQVIFAFSSASMQKIKDEEKQYHLSNNQEEYCMAFGHAATHDAWREAILMLDSLSKNTR